MTAKLMNLRPPPPRDATISRPLRKSSDKQLAQTTVTVLGAGDAFASKGLFQAGYVIKSDAGTVLLDAGPTLLASMKHAGISPAELDIVLVSHLHGDHIAGLPFLILEYLWESPRKRQLTVAGPRHLEERTWALWHAMYPESDASRVARWLKFVVLEPHKVTHVGKLSVSCIRTPHTVKDVSLAMRIGVDGKTVVFTGDTGWTDELVELSRDADLFLCECTYFESAQFVFHLNYPLIARNRGRFDVKRMLLTHIGREVLEHAAEVKIPMADDGMIVRL